MPIFARERLTLNKNTMTENESTLLSANRVAAFLRKDPDSFTINDIIKYVTEMDCRMVNFMYPGGDGRLKTLNFYVNSLEYLKTILTCGERVDGSSLFSFVEASNSDLYVVPRFRTAFQDPFAEVPTLCMFCSFYDRNGNPLECGPEHTLKKAMRAFTDVTGMEFHAMGELEYYVMKPHESAFPARDQHGYHESAPYAKTNDFRARCMKLIAQCGGQMKYGHSEVGNFVEDGINFEQNEIEFLPIKATRCAEEILLAKWIIRNEAYREGLDVTFAPKITVGKAGSGMHIHMRLMKGDRNVMLKGYDLSEEALRAIAGMMDLAPSITAFGNKNPTSYFRLVPHQEAPTNVCWGKSNRSALVRVPLGWTTDEDLCHKANPSMPLAERDYSGKQTVEMRSPDASADIYQLLAGLCVACRHGFEMPNALEVAKRTFVDVNIHDEKNEQVLDSLGQLPDSCAASADCLERQRAIYEDRGVFSKALIDGILAELRAYGDRTLRHDVANDPEAQKKLVERYLEC